MAIVVVRPGLTERVVIFTLADRREASARRPSLRSLNVLVFDIPALTAPIEVLRNTTLRRLPETLSRLRERTVTLPLQSAGPSQWKRIFTRCLRLALSFDDWMRRRAAADPVADFGTRQVAGVDPPASTR